MSTAIYTNTSMETDIIVHSAVQTEKNPKSISQSEMKKVFTDAV